ncbi:MAG: phosphoribosylformylglycinamidine cyclo-ligase [Chloroflexi bacterium]|nr:phosphoribosylformylglycinamidine cyclo-ligase [Chloroflexota bacterium]
MSPEDRSSISYAEAGVDVEAAGRLVSRFARLARGTRRPEVIADVGPFAGLFRLTLAKGESASGGGYRDPVLVASTDSVGTKVKLAALLGRYHGLGHDVVSQNVNDIITTGAEPLFFLDYIGGCGLDDDAKLSIVRGVADACREAGCALLGGETAEMPGVYAPGDLDLVGFVVGVVERDAVIDGSRIGEGDVLLGSPSSGLHTNGYTLVRKVFGVGIGGDPAEERRRLSRRYPGLKGTPSAGSGQALGDELLRPHRCYYNELKTVMPRLKGIAHISGGGIPGNLPRILPEGLGARVDRTAWEVPPIFRLIQEQGSVAEEEMWRVFNMGIGMIVAVSPADAEAVRSALPEAVVVGEVVRGAGERKVICP